MKILIAAVLFGAITTPALADQSDCQADLAKVVRIVLGYEVDENDPLALLPDLQPVLADGRCILRNPVLQVPNARGFTSLEAEEISWRSTWPDDLDGTLPQALVLDIRKAQTVSQFDDLEDFSYQTRLNAELNSMDLHLDYAFDPAEQRFALTRLDAAQTNGDRLSLSGAIENFDLSVLFGPAPQRNEIMEFRLTDLDLQLRNVGMFESIALIWLNLIYPQFGDTPEAAVGNAKVWLAEQVRTMPAFLLTQDSRAALIAMIETLPHPSGVMHLMLRAETGIAIADLTPAFEHGQPTWAQLEAPLAGVRLSADWQPPETCDCGDDW